MEAKIKKPREYENRVKGESVGVNNEVTDRNEIRNGAERVTALLRRGERLQTEVTTVAGEPDPKSELVGSLDRIHWGATVCV